MFKLSPECGVRAPLPRILLIITVHNCGAYIRVLRRVSVCDQRACVATTFYREPCAPSTEPKYRTGHDDLALSSQPSYGSVSPL